MRICFEEMRICFKEMQISFLKIAIYPDGRRLITVSACWINGLRPGTPSALLRVASS